MDDVRQLVDDKRALLQARGYNLVEIWECEWQARKETDADVAAFVARLALQDPLDPQDAFYGGHTNAIKLYHHVCDKEEIRYDELTSLYPWVNMYGWCGAFLYEPGTTDLSPYFRLAKCTILPPENLYHPVLPYRSQIILTFPLCCTCVKDQLDRPLLAKSITSAHTDEHCALTGTWCAPELDEGVAIPYPPRA